MKRTFLAFPILGFLITSCMQSNDSIVSQRYIHKYGFEVTQDDWKAREKEGQIVSVLKNGITVTQSYENGQLHGKSSFTFPYSSIVQKVKVYDYGTLLKEITHDESGIPQREDVYEFDNRHIITLWDKNGVPMSIEEYDNDQLIEGSYYNPKNELEATIEGGKGERVRRDRNGLLLARETFDDGMLTHRITYYGNGEVHTRASFQNYLLNGSLVKYTEQGNLYLQEDWKEGILDGIKVTYRQNGQKIAEIPYESGKKQGIERRYDSDGQLASEVSWNQDIKHGCETNYVNGNAKNYWYFQGKKVTHDRFQTLEDREVALNSIYQMNNE